MEVLRWQQQVTARLCRLQAASPTVLHAITVEVPM